MKYRYADPRLLNRLVDVIDKETSKHVTVRMVPEMPEFLQNRKAFYDMPRSEYERAMDRLGIHRNYCLKVNYDIYSGEPRIEYGRRNKAEYRDGEEKVADEWSPLDVFFGRKKFQYIIFEDFGVLSVEPVQRAVRLAIKNGYVVDYISMGLNPRSYTSDHYYDGTDYSAHLYVGGGEITITGDFKEKEMKELPDILRALEGQITLALPENAGSI